MKRRLLRTACVLGLATFITAGATVANADAPQETYIDTQYVRACEQIGEEYCISPEVLEAIIEAESSGNPNAYNGKYGCKGLCQINSRAHLSRLKRLGITNLYDGRQNITVAADILLELFEKYDDLPTVLMCYHGESRAVYKGQVGEFSTYARKIMSRAKELERVHGK